MKKLDDFVLKVRSRFQRRITTAQLLEEERREKARIGRVKEGLSDDQHSQITDMAGALKDHIREYERSKAPESWRTKDEYMRKQSAEISGETGLDQRTSSAVLSHEFKRVFGESPDAYSMNQWKANLFKTPEKSREAAEAREAAGNADVRRYGARKGRDSDRGHDRGR